MTLLRTDEMQVVGEWCRWWVVVQVVGGGAGGG